MDNPVIWLIAAICFGFYSVFKFLEKALKELTVIRQKLSEIDLKPIAVEQMGQGSELRTIAYELYLLRRIAEEKTGVSEDDVTAADNERRDKKFEQLRESIAKRDSSRETR